MFKGFCRIKNNFLLLSVCVLLLIFVGRAAGLTPAGREIRNQSVAIYQDTEGNPYTTTSNEVITTVAPVYSFEITPNTTPAVPPGDFSANAALTQNVAPGSIVYYSYYLTNTGNTLDTFLFAYFNNPGDSTDPVEETIMIYQDIGGDGAVDAGDRLLLRSSPSNANEGVFSGTGTTEVGANEIIALIVAYKVPVNAQDGWTIDLDINGQSQGDPSKYDEFSNESTTTVVDGRGILTIRKRVNPTDAKPGDILTYTISGSNTGNAYVRGTDLSDRVDIGGDGSTDIYSGVLIYDRLPEELNPGTGNDPNIIMISWAPSSAKILYTADDPNDIVNAVWTTLTQVGAREITGVAMLIPDTSPEDDVSNNALAMGQSYEMTFKIPIDAQLAVTPVTITNVSAVDYNDGVNDNTEESNDSMTDVGAEPTQVMAGVELGPMGDPDSNSNPSDSSMTPIVIAPGSPLYNLIDDPLTTQSESLEYWNGLDSQGLEQTVGDRHAGQVAYFVNSVENTGTNPDIFNITVDANGLDSGYQVQLLKTDGLTPLTDVSGDAISDTGTLNPGEIYHIVVKVIIPGNTPGNNIGQDIIVTARSTNDSTKSDPTTDRITTVLAVSVDIATHGPTTGDYTGDSDPNNDTPAAQEDPNCPIQGYFDFVIDIENVYQDGTETGARDTFTLNLTDTQPDWVYGIYKDINGNGMLDPEEMIQITNTGALRPGSSVAIIVRIIPPENETSNTYTTHLTATSTLNANVTDTLDLIINIGECNVISIEPNGSRTSVPGGTITYCHEVTNMGNTRETWNLTYTSTEGYQAVFIDTNGKTFGAAAVIGVNYLAADGADPDILDPGESIGICIKVFVPSDAPAGTTDIITVIVTDANQTISDRVIDVTTVIAGNLQLDKVADRATVEPTVENPQGAEDFHPLTYTTTYSNFGNADVQNVYIYDMIPDNTRIVVETDPVYDVVKAPSCPDCVLNDPNNPPIQYSNDSGLTWDYTPSASGRTDHSDPSVDQIKFFIGTVPSGGTGTVTFQVLVD